MLLQLNVGPAILFSHALFCSWGEIFIITITVVTFYEAHLLTCWKLSGRESLACGRIGASEHLFSFFFLILCLALVSIHQLSNFRTNTVEPHKTLFNGSFQADAQTRTNAWIHGDPKMQMKRGPDTFHRGTSCHETAVMLLHTGWCKLQLPW